VKEKIRLEPGCSALYAWQDPTGKRELIWKSTDKDKDFKDELIKVSSIILLDTGKYLCIILHFCDIFWPFEHQLLFASLCYFTLFLIVCNLVSQYNFFLQSVDNFYFLLLLLLFLFSWMFA